MKRYVKSNLFLTSWRMVGEYDDGSIREVNGDTEEECIERLYNLGGKYGGMLVNYYGVDNDHYRGGERTIEVDAELMPIYLVHVGDKVADDRSDKFVRITDIEEHDDEYSVCFEDGRCECYRMNDYLYVI